MKFEYKITLAYLVIGSIWIIFSDKVLESLIQDIDVLSDLQTYKGWFYVTVTAVLFFLFLRKHLLRLRTTEAELEKHRNNLEQLIDEKTKTLDIAVGKLRIANNELSQKNTIINEQNSELKNTLQNLEQTQSQLFRAEKMASLGVLTSGVAHEINNPLNYILGGITGLEKHLGEEKDRNSKVRLYIESIKTGVQKAGAIVSGLDKFSKNKTTYDEDCNVHEIINNCLAILNGYLKNNITVIKQFWSGTIIVEGNSGELHQVFTNIIVNAIQAIEEKGTITISTEPDNHSAVIKIADDGCGIAVENMDKITDPFFTTREPGKGTGLGLSVVYNIVQAHKGNIRFQSVLNKGTSVVITLPVKTFIHG